MSDDLNVFLFFSSTFITWVILWGFVIRPESWQGVVGHVILNMALVAVALVLFFSTDGQELLLYAVLGGTACISAYILIHLLHLHWEKEGTQQKVKNGTLSETSDEEYENLIIVEEARLRKRK